MSNVSIIFKRLNIAQLKKIISIEISTLDPKNDKEEELKLIWDGIYNAFFEIVDEQHKKKNYKYLFDEKFLIFDNLHKLYKKMNFDKKSVCFLITKKLIDKKYYGEAALIISRKKELMNDSEYKTLHDTLKEIISQNKALSKVMTEIDKDNNKFWLNKYEFGNFENFFINIFELYALYIFDRSILDEYILRYIDDFISITVHNLKAIRNFNFYSTFYLPGSAIYDKLYIFEKEGSINSKHIEIDTKSYFGKMILSRSVFSYCELKSLSLINVDSVVKFIKAIIPLINEPFIFLSILYRLDNGIREDTFKNKVDSKKIKNLDTTKLKEVRKFLLQNLESHCKNSNKNVKKQLEQLVADLRLLREEINVIPFEEVEDILTPLLDEQNIKKIIFEYKLK